MKEYQKRALRTFAQAFFGTLSTQIIMATLLVADKTSIGMVSKLMSIY